jgi:hypothetical protein
MQQCRYCNIVMCDDCMNFMTGENKCGMCDRHFNNTEELTQHILKNKIRCKLCDEFIKQAIGSYCTEYDPDEICEDCILK